MATVEKKKRVKGAKSSPKPKAPPPVRTPQSIARLACELCGFTPMSANRWIERQDHIARAHFMDKVEAAFGGNLSKNCPVEGCKFTARDKRDCMRHYYNTHKMIDQWMKETLAARGIVYDPTYKRGRPAELKAKKKYDTKKITVVFNKPSQVGSFPCTKCGQKFDDRSHLVAHNKYMHLRYGDDDKKWLDAHRCDICGKLFVEKKYVKTHKANVHEKQKVTFPCHLCKKELASKKYLTAHLEKKHKVKLADGSSTGNAANTKISTPITFSISIPSTSGLSTSISSVSGPSTSNSSTATFKVPSSVPTKPGPSTTQSKTPSAVSTASSRVQSTAPTTTPSTSGLSASMPLISFDSVSTIDLEALIKV